MTNEGLNMLARDVKDALNIRLHVGETHLGSPRDSECMQDGVLHPSTRFQLDVLKWYKAERSWAMCPFEIFHHERDSLSVEQLRLIVERRMKQAVESLKHLLYSELMEIAGLTDEFKEFMKR